MPEPIAANALLRLALGNWFNVQASFAPAPTPDPRPFPLLAPNAAWLTDGVLAWSDDDSPQAQPRWLAFRDVRDFIRRVASLEGRSLTQCAGPPGAVLMAEGYSRLADELPGLRRFELTVPEPTSHHVGELDGLAVWLTRKHSDGDRVRVGVDPDDRADVASQLAARGVHLTGGMPS